MSEPGSLLTTVRVIPADLVSTGDVIAYDGPFPFTGRVVNRSQATIMLMDHRGCFCRIYPETGPLALVARTDEHESFVASVADARLALITRNLLKLRGICEAIVAACKAPFDPAGYDRWMLPSAEFCGIAPLKSAAQVYLSGSAHFRRHFEATVNMMQGARQRDVLLRNVMGSTHTRDLVREYGVRPQTIRMARLRSRQNIERYTGATL